MDKNSEWAASISSYKILYVFVVDRRGVWSHFKLIYHHSRNEKCDEFILEKGK